MVEADTITMSEAEQFIVDEKIREQRIRNGNKGIVALLHLSMALSKGMDDFGGFPLGHESAIKCKYEDKKESMKMTNEELEKMASLGGKEKKKFVKEMKEKYK